MKKYVIGVTATLAVLAATISPAFASTNDTSPASATTAPSTTTTSGTVQPNEWPYIW